MTEPRSTPRRNWLFLPVSLAFGLGALYMAAGHLVIPLGFLDMTIDPREALVTLGSALTGPWGALVIGALAGIFHPVPQAWLPSVLMHCAGGLFIALAFRWWIRPRRSAALRLILWILAVTTYYFVILGPFLLFGMVMPAMFGSSYTLEQAGEFVLPLYHSLLAEALFTTTVTSLWLMLAPVRLREPLA